MANKTKYISTSSKDYLPTEISSYNRNQLKLFVSEMINIK